MPQRHEDTKNHKGNFQPLSDKEEQIGRAIVDAAYIVSLIKSGITRMVL